MGTVAVLGSRTEEGRPDIGVDGLSESRCTFRLVEHTF